MKEASLEQMTAARTDPASLRAMIARVEKEINDLSSSIADFKAIRARLTAERETLLIPARSKKDEVSMRRLLSIDEDLSRLSRDIADDEGALALLRIQFDSMDRELAAAEWGSERTALLKLLNGTLKSNLARKLLTSVREVKLIATQMATEEESLAAAVAKFDPRLRHESSVIKRMQIVRADLLGAELNDVIPTPLNGHYLSSLSKTDVEIQLARAIGQVIDAVERLEIRD